MGTRKWVKFGILGLTVAGLALAATPVSAKEKAMVKHCRYKQKQSKKGDQPIQANFGDSLKSMQNGLRRIKHNLHEAKQTQEVHIMLDSENGRAGINFTF